MYLNCLQNSRDFLKWMDAGLKSSFLRLLLRKAILLPLLMCPFSSLIISMKHIEEKEEVK